MLGDKGMKLLDLFCGAGGAAMGYYRAGFTEIIGVDIDPQRRYPFEFVQDDALEFVGKFGYEFDVIHASPICKGNTKLNAIHKRNYPDQIPETRRLLKMSGRPYIIENVLGADLINPLRLDGSMFGLKVIRPRLFETIPVIWFPPMKALQNGKCAPRGEYDRGQYGLITVAGHNFAPSVAKIAMGINWMTGAELSQAIPPAYTEWLGRQIIEAIH